MTTIKTWCPCERGIYLLECTYVYVCAQKNERLTHLFMRIFLLVLFPDFHVVVLFFLLLRVHVQSFIFYFVMGIKVAFLIPPPHTFVTHDETNQAKYNKSSNEQTVTN